MSLPETFVPGFHDEAAVRKMRYNPLGKTGMQVSHISFGGAALGGKYLYGEFEEANAIATVQEALKLGINYIDTAPWYGQGKSEEVLGKALRGIPRKAYYIATKVARYDLDVQKMYDFTKEKTLWSVDNSLKLLGLDYVDLIQIHDVDLAPSVDIVVNETLPALQSVVDAGKARYIGVTGYIVSALKEVVERSPVKISTVLSYARETLIDDALKSYLPYFQNHGVELARIALNHTIRQPGYATHLIGMNSREVLHSNLDLLHNGISDQEKKVQREVQTKYLDTIKPCNWEYVELNAYKENLKALS